MALDYRAYPILYVDDESQNLVAFRYAMEESFSVVTATTGREALEILADQEIAVMISDQRMPGMNGVELCRRAREVRPGAIRMIMTAYADMHAAIDAINDGHVSRYLVKPWRNEELGETLRAAVELVHLQRTVQSMEMRLLQSGQVAAATTIYEELVHELSNPLGALEINASLVSDLLSGALSDDALPNAARDSLVMAAEAHTDSMAAIDQLKGLVARVRSGRRPGQKSWRGRCDVARVVDATVRIVRAELEQSARVSLELEPTATAAIEGSVLGQIVLNLLLNASQAMLVRPRGENQIAVRVTNDGAVARITVTDNGPGIPPEHLPRIFDPFFTTKETGTGLGLAICRELVAQSHGTIAVDSAMGRGSTFTLSLPRASDE
jgi:two-component system, NtrC family, sensor kinase